MFSYTRVVVDDAEHLMGLINELAEYEKMPEQVVMTAEKLRENISSGLVKGFIVRQDGAVVGMNLYYIAFSTWDGPYIHMEDLYVRPEYRKHGIGKVLFQKLAQDARDLNYRRVEWNVLKWNVDAIAFYNKVRYTDLTSKEDWLHFRMDQASITEFANRQI